MKEEEELKTIFKFREPNIFKRDTPQIKQDGDITNFW
jgi:hypothetical protein